MRVRDAPRRNPHQFHRLQDDTGIYSLERSGAPDSTFVYCTSNENKDKCKHDNSFMCGTVWQDYFESTRVDSAQPTSCLNATDRSTVVFDYPFQLAPYYQWYAANPQCCLKVAKNLLTHRCGLGRGARSVLFFLRRRFLQVSHVLAVGGTARQLHQGLVGHVSVRYVELQVRLRVHAHV